MKTLRYFKHTYILLILVHLFVGCRTTKLVPEGKYLLKKNKIEVSKSTVQADDIDAIIRQQPNTKMVFFKFNLKIYNSIDSVKVAEKRERKNIKIRLKNKSRLAKQKEINDERIAEAREKNETYYTEKIKKLKDTLEPSLFLREWLKNKIGEKPVVFDSTLYNKTLEQIGAYLKKKGYYFSKVSGTVKYKKNHKAVVTYVVDPGRVYIIDSVYIDKKEIPCTNDAVLSYYHLFVEKNGDLLSGHPFDKDYLEEYRMKVVRFMKDQAIFGYSPAHFTYLVYNEDMRVNPDSTLSVKLGIQLAERMVHSEDNPDVIVKKKYRVTFVKDVFFHIVDTNLYAGNYKNEIKRLGLSPEGGFLPTLDSLVYDQLKIKGTDDVDSSRIAHFLYNGELFLHPELLEVQSLLMKNNIYTETNLEKTHVRLQQMGLFQTIKIELKEIPDTKYIQVHYYLVPAKKESFSFQPRLTTSNGFLGLSAGLSFVNKNLFKGAEKLTFGISGGFQAQPAIFEESVDPSDIKGVTNKFYQFEIGPSLKLELPGLYPIKNSKTKKLRLGKTVISTAYSFQNRDVFSKKIFQFNYSWKYVVGSSQTYLMGVPGLSVINYANIRKTVDFEAKLNALNDVFLRNTYSNQFVWQDWKVVAEYRNVDKLFKNSKSTLYFNGSIDVAGNMLSLIKKHILSDTTGQYLNEYTVFGLVYSQFVRADAQLIYSHPVKKTRSINLRALGGAGYTYGNSKTSMPYDYSFYAGGSNDVRGWKARALGPGSYKYYLDTNRTAIQLGDIKISGSAEYRFKYSEFLKGAFFIDAGNIWTTRDDINRPGSKFKFNSWYKEIALATGMGVRMDFDFFIVRFDLGFPVHNPALPEGERWVFQTHKGFRKEIADFIMANPTMDLNKIDYRPFFPNVSFGIGYPF